MNPLALHEIAHQVGDMFDATIKNRVPADSAGSLMIFTEKNGYVVSDAASDIGVLFTVLMNDHFKRTYAIDSCLSDDDIAAFTSFSDKSKHHNGVQMSVVLAILFATFAAKTRLIEEIAEKLTEEAGVAMLPERPLFDAIRPFTKTLLAMLKAGGHTAARNMAKNSGPLLDLPRAIPVNVPSEMLTQFRTLMGSDAITNNSVLSVLTRKPVHDECN